MAFIGNKYQDIHQTEEMYSNIKKEKYLLFYLKEKTVFIDNNNFNVIRPYIIDKLDCITTYYKQYINNEYVDEFCQYVKLFDNKVLKNISLVKRVFMQWMQLYMTIMHLGSSSLIHYQTKVLEKIEESQTFDELVSIFLDFMKRSQHDLMQDGKMSVEIMKAIEFIRNNIGSNLSLPLVAEKVNFSHGYLSYMFKSELNMNFTTFVLNLRIKKAKIYLTQSNLKLYEIANQIGFNDPSYFNKVFKKKTGFTPNNFRKQHTLIGVDHEE